MNVFMSNLQELKGKGQEKAFYAEHRKLLRQYETLNHEISTYENNIAFFSSSSKGVSGMVKELELKINKMKKERQLLMDQIKLMEKSAE